MKRKPEGMLTYRWMQSVGGRRLRTEDLSGLISKQTKQIHLLLTYRYSIHTQHVYLAQCLSLSLVLSSSVKMAEGESRKQCCQAKEEERRMIEEASLEEKEKRRRRRSLLRRLKGLVLSSLLDHNVSWAMFDQ